MLLPLFPLRTVLFPGMVLPLHIFEHRYREMVNLCLDTRQPFGVLLIHTGQEVGSSATPHRTGTYGNVTRVERLPDGRLNIQMLGQERFQVAELHHDRPYLTGHVEPFPLAGADQPEARRLAARLSPWLGRYLTALGQTEHGRLDTHHIPLEPAALAYLAAIVAQVPMEEKQHLLEIPAAAELLEAERRLYRREVALARVLHAIDQQEAPSIFLPN